MPEFHLDKKKIKKNFPEIEIPESMGTLSTYNYLDSSIHNLEDTIKNLESIVSQHPSVNEIVYPTIDWMKETRNFMAHNVDELISLKKSELDEYEKSVKDYEKMINNPKVKEPDLQNYFKKMPILVERGLTKLIPKKSFGGEEFPDFIAVLHNGNHVLIEIEKPTDKIYTKRGNPSAKFSHAEQQIRNYLKWANEDKEFLRKRDLPNISAENTKGLVIIGMSENLSPKEKDKLKMHNFSSRSTHEIKTFDEILVENQQVIRSIREATTTKN